nr:MAG TPA: hypothetical protein [Caudoviricetes sp.]
MRHARISSQIKGEGRRETVALPSNKESICQQTSRETGNRTAAERHRIIPRNRAKIYGRQQQHKH